MLRLPEAIAMDRGSDREPVLGEGPGLLTNDRPPTNNICHGFTGQFRRKRDTHLEHFAGFLVILAPEQNSGTADIDGRAFVPIRFTALAVLQGRLNWKSLRSSHAAGRGFGRFTRKSLVVLGH